MSRDRQTSDGMNRKAVATSFLRRLLGAALIAAAVFFPLVIPARAQDTVLTGVEHSESVQYGESVEFNLRANLPAPAASARLAVYAEHLAVPHRVDLSLTSGQSVTLSQSIPVSDLELPPFARLRAVWEFTDESGNLYTTQAFPVRYIDNSVPWVWAETTEGDITVYTDGSDPRIRDAALEIAASALAQARRTLGVSGPQEVHLFVYPELAELAHSLRLHGENVQDWVAAYAIPSYHAALVSAQAGQEMLVNLQRDVPHEMTHLVVAEAAGANIATMPGWFNEGLALLSTPDPDPTLTDVLHTAAQDGQLLPLEALCAPRYSGLSPRDTALAYAQSESVMRYIGNRFGTARVQALLAAYAQGAGCQAGVRQALGVSLAQLETQWHNDLLSQAARAPGESSSLIPWLVAWLVSLGLALLFIAPQPKHSVAGQRAQP